jgi:hypothetical protein
MGHWCIGDKNSKITRNDNDNAGLHTMPRGRTIIEIIISS